MTPDVTRERMGSILTFAGLILLPTAGGLLVSGTGRSVAAWIAPVGLASVVLGIAVLRGVGVPRWALLALLLVIAGASVAIALWFYSISRPPSVVY
jgi:hypothetical protein